MNFFVSISGLLPPMLWMLLSGFFFASGDVTFRFWYEKSSSLIFAAAMFISMIGIFCMAMSFPGKNIALAVIVTILFNIIIYLAFAYFIYDEVITLKQAIGLTIAFVAIYILEDS